MRPSEKASKKIKNELYRGCLEYQQKIAFGGIGNQLLI